MRTRHALTILGLALVVHAPAALAEDKLGGPGGSDAAAPGTSVGGTSAGGPSIGVRGGVKGSTATPVGGVTGPTVGAAAAPRDRHCIEVRSGEVARTAAPAYRDGSIEYGPLSPTPAPGAFEPAAPSTIARSPGC
jgi:hypothetical protein